MRNKMQKNVYIPKSQNLNAANITHFTVNYMATHSD